MKYLLTIILCTMLSFCIAASLELNDSRAFDSSTHSAGNILLDVSNRGTWTGLTYPSSSDTKYLYIGAQWISATKYRRDLLGRKLYWVATNPTMDSSQVISSVDPLWTPHLRPVIDSLTTVGFDGDQDVYELLPAYNPLNGTVPIYDQFSHLDMVLTSILGYPGHRPFQYPDQQNNYCFTIPTSSPTPSPGFETNTAYFYDFCPFGTPGDRDFGMNSNNNTHVPLKVAIEQKSYAWGLQVYANYLILENTLWNCSTVDTLFNVSLGSYFDCDAGPDSWGSSIALDDVSGYVRGTGYNFAYSRDYDTDNGLTTGLIGLKMIVPGQTLDTHAWFWRVGDGPDDTNPLGLYPSFAARRTANEKFWLMTGRNPNYSKYTDLIPTGTITEYEQPTPNDTRFLYSLSKDEPNAGPINRYLNIAPLGGLKYYTVIFAATSMDELKIQAAFAEPFVNNNLSLGNVDGLTCIPYINSLTRPSLSTINLNWHSYTNPDHFEIMYKLADAPASTWQSISIPGNIRTGMINNLQYMQTYKIKVAAIFNPGPSEVYLESQTRIETIDDSLPIDEHLQVISPARNYPNPFNPSTTIRYSITSGTPVQIEIYNLKGQLVRHLENTVKSAGTHESRWDGTDDQGKGLGSGIYLCRIRGGSQVQTLKMLLLK